MIENSELRQKLYAEARADLLKRQLSNSENADRAVLNVSTASLGFSLAFLKDITHLDNAALHGWMYLSWALFVLSIIVTLVSFFTSQKAINQQLEIAHRYYLEGDEDAIKIIPKFATITEKLNNSGAVLLVIGLLITCMFVGSNLSKGKNMSDKKQTNDGAPVPSMQRIPDNGTLEYKGANIPILQTIPIDPQIGTPVPSLQKIPEPPVPKTTEDK